MVADHRRLPRDLRPSPVDVVRRLMLGVLLLGMTGLVVELTLLAHYEDAQQLIPLVMLGLGIVGVILDLILSRRWTRTIVETVMALLIVAGLLGVYFHYAGSREFQREMDPAMTGMTLVWHVLRAKSPPTLAPGAMVQMGILGLGYAYLRRRL
jgi:predicted membrane channel-forming protein YqfA (hemolysin III family)